MNNKNIEAIESLIEKGIYSVNFNQPKWAQSFFLKVIDCFIDNNTKNVLECGIGTGFWIKLLFSRYPYLKFYGFDLSDKMIELAKKNLNFFSQILIKKGNILDTESFCFDDVSIFDIIFCYDVIQQLSSEDYLKAIYQMLSHASKNGLVIIFDNEKFSFYSFKMTFKKMITKFLKIPLVPLEFCNVRYPSLNYLKKEIEKNGYECQLLVAPNRIKRALIIFNKT